MYLCVPSFTSKLQAGSVELVAISHYIAQFVNLDAITVEMEDQ